MHQPTAKLAQRSSKQCIDVIWPDLKTCMPQMWRVALRCCEAIQQDGHVRMKRMVYRRHYLHHRGPIQVDRTALPPCPPVVWEVQFHEMASHRSKHHVAGLPIDQVIKEEQRVVIGAAQTSKGSLVSSESRPHRACQHKVSTHGLYNMLACVKSQEANWPGKQCDAILQLGIFPYVSGKRLASLQGHTCSFADVLSCCSMLPTLVLRCCSSQQH